jgi:hypothetical protein
MQPVKLNYKIYQGSTFHEAYRWESETKAYLPIQAIDKSAPCLITTTVPPTLPVGWRFRVVGAGGMKELNNSGDSFYIATEVNTVNKTIEINQVNSLLYTTYTSGGVVEYNEPVDLTNFNARMQIRESVDSTTALHSATTENGQIIIDNTYKTISILIPASVTTNFTFTTAVYSLELYTSGGEVIPFLVGNLTLVPEVTR